MKKIVSIIVVLFLCCDSTNAQNQLILNPYPKTISVTGSAEMEVIPDEIYVQVDLKEYKKRGGDKMELETIKSNFLSSCKAIGIPDSLVSISSYEGNNYNYWILRRRKDPNMFATISYQVKFRDSKKLDELVDKLDDDATANFQIVKVSHSRIAEFRKQLKMQAIKQAKQKATYLTEAIDEKLGEAVSINEPAEDNGYNFTVNKTSNFMLKEDKIGDYAGANGDAAINFKKIKLKYDVSVVFALK